MYKTPLESYVEELYRLIGITEPSQLDLFAIGERLGVNIYTTLSSSKAIRFKGTVSISIDSRLSPSEQWQDFGHELFHVLRDTGNQLRVPSYLIEHYEHRAENFALEFCIPTFMLSKIDLHPIIGQAASQVSDFFNVTPEFALKKLERYYRNLYQYHLDLQLNAMIVAEKEVMRREGADLIRRVGNKVCFYRKMKEIVLREGD